MPLISSPALVQTGNGANMYLPIEGDASIFPPNVATENNVPLNFNGNVIIDPLPVNVVASGVPADVGLIVNGPTFIDYVTKTSIRPNVSLSGSAGASTTFRGKLASQTLTANKDFEPAIGNYDFQGTYNLGQTYLIDIGPIRIVWGTTKILTTATPRRVPLDFNSVPANTYQGVIGQNAQGLFVGNCLGFANMNNNIAFSAGNRFLFSVLNGSTSNTPGNITIDNTGYTPILDPNPNLQFDFIAIGLAKTV